MAFAAAAIGGSSIIGGITSLIGSSQTASAANKAANLSQQRYTTTRGDLLPYTQAGQNMLQPLQTLATSGPTGGGPDYVGTAASMQPGQMSQAQLEATPGYQFTRSQGLNALAGSQAARGLGVSGAALKGATTYATGLADSTYKDQFNIAQQRFSDVLGLNAAQQGNLTNQFARLSGIATIGENAGAQTGSVGANLAATAGNYLNQAGIDTAAGTSGIGSAATGAAQSYLNYNNYQNMLSTIGANRATGAYQTPSLSSIDPNGPVDPAMYAPM